MQHSESLDIQLMCYFLIENIRKGLVGTPKDEIHKIKVTAIPQKSPLENLSLLNTKVVFPRNITQNETDNFDNIVITLDNYINNIPVTFAISWKS